MKGLQLRVQLRILTGFPLVSNENHFSAKINNNSSETAENEN
jgi:hypothetical protein